MSTCPSRASRLLTALLTMPLKQMWPYVNTFMRYLRSTLDDSVPLYVQGAYFVNMKIRLSGHLTVVVLLQNYIKKFGYVSTACYRGVCG